MHHTIRKPNTTLDEVVYQHYGASFGYLETVLNANPFLANEDVFLSEGLVIELPEMQASTSVARIKLWE